MPRTVPTPGRIIAALAAAVLASGCAWTPAHTASPTVSASAGHGFGLAIEQRSDFELDVAASEESSARADRPEKSAKPITPALFWTGVVVGGVGLATAITGVSLGTSSERRIQDGEQSGISRAEREDLVQRGERGNVTAIVGGVLSFVGLGLTTGVVGVDYSRCGPIISKRRRTECETLMRTSTRASAK